MSLPADSQFSDFVSTDPTKSLSLAVVGNTRPKPTEQMVRSLFERQPVEIPTGQGSDPDSRIGTLDDGDDPIKCDRVVLFEDGEIVAESPLSVLEATILPGRSAWRRSNYRKSSARSQTRRFTSEGSPNRTQKNCRSSSSHGTSNGSRMNTGARIARRSSDSLGSMTSAGRQTSTGSSGGATVDTHVYGVPDWVPPREPGLKLHGGYAVDYERTWFVVHRLEATAAALVAIEVGPNERLGEWTFDRERVAAVETEVKENL